MDWFLYDRDLRHERVSILYNLLSKLTETEPTLLTILRTISQNSQENIGVGVSFFNKIAGSRTATLL